MPKPSVVVQRESDDQHHRQADLTGGGGVADREPLGEVVQPDPDRDHQREPAGGVAPQRYLYLIERRGARPSCRWAHTPLRELVHPHEAEQSDAEGHREHCAVARGMGEIVAAERLVDGRPRVGGHIPEQEDQDAGGGGIECGLQSRHRRFEPAERQTQEDGGARDSAEQCDLTGRHQSPLALPMSRRYR